MASSNIAWLDFRRDDLARAREFIKSMQDEGVLDELGFLALQGAFADRFYPATSTLMRSARYLYFIAAIYRGLERKKGVTAANVDRTARVRMDELRDALAANETTGVIGRDAKLDIKRPPSHVYWSGLRQLGFFTSPLSEAGYQDRFDDLRSARRAFLDDDKTPQANAVQTFWDGALPTARFLNDEGRFKDSTSFKLSRAEARDLEDRFKTHFPDSLLTCLVLRRRHDLPFPWAIPKPPDALAPHLHHAEALSLLARGATIQYFQLVQDAREAGKLPVKDLDIEGAFQSWWSAARPVLRRWDPAALVSLPDVVPAVRHGARGDLAFLRGWLARLFACSSAKALLGDPEARRLVRQRESDVKPVKARLKHRKHLVQWNMSAIPETAHQLEYRHGIGTSFVREIVTGLGATE